MRRWALWLLSAYLLIWCPLNFAVELSSVLPSLGLRGPLAAFELVLHGAAAAVAFAAGWALRANGPQGIPLARIALVVTAAVSIQSLYWSVLPGQTRPGDELPLAIVAAGWAGGWLLYLGSRAFSGR